MKLAILSRNPKLYSTSSLKEAAERAGHEVDVIDYLKMPHEYHLDEAQYLLGR